MADLTSSLAMPATMSLLVAQAQPSLVAVANRITIRYWQITEPLEGATPIRSKAVRNSLSSEAARQTWLTRTLRSLRSAADNLIRPVTWARLWAEATQTRLVAFPRRWAAGLGTQFRRMSIWQ